MTTTTTQRQPHNGDGGAVSYAKLEQPWRDWAKIARNFTLQLDNPQDREDLRHDIIVGLAEVTEKYRKQGRTLTRWGSHRAAHYIRLQFYHEQGRWRRVGISLYSDTQDGDGDKIELAQTIPAKDGINLEEWLDFKNYYWSRPPKERRAIRKLVFVGWRNLSGYDWRMIRAFREAYQLQA